MTTPKNWLASAGIAAAVFFASNAAGLAMELTSPEFVNGATLPLAQVNSRCGGENRSPALSWTGAPAGTRSFALTLFDPDAGGGRGFWHWLVIDIPARTTGLAGNAGSGIGLPSGAVQSTNDFGDTSYGGACPPAGSSPHHYVFTLYAMGISKVPEAGKAALAAYLKSLALASAALTARFGR